MTRWVLTSFLAVAMQSVYPTGTTIYNPERAWNGYTVLSPLQTQAVIVIDMNGNIVKRWDGYNNSAGGPARIFPDGSVMAASGSRPPSQESLELIHRDFEGNVIWRFSERQHHDWQREDFPAGYYSPEAKPSITGSNTLILTHTNHTRANIADAPLEDDRLIEVSPKGDIVWQWVAADHVDEFGFSPDARQAIKSVPGFNKARGSFDWLHINSATYVGPNNWFDKGDKRFAPNNVIISSRQASFIAIVARDGSIAWQLGPDFTRSRELQTIRQIIGQHHPHIIPKGLPGAGNLLVFDNGGSSGYGLGSPIAPDGQGTFARAGSRVLEINPVTLELVWSYSAARFFSNNISSAQRLANGNTLVTEGANGRIFEVTKEGNIVWEYMNPLFGGPQASNNVYRAYRVPYEWIAQIPRPKEVPVVPPARGEFRVPSAALQTPSLPPPFPRDGAARLLENDRVMVWDVAWLRQAYPVHRHVYDYAGVYYTSGDRIIVSESGARSPAATAAWDTFFFRRGVTHSEEGASDAPLRAVFVEFKESTPLGPADMPSTLGKKLRESERVVISELVPAPSLHSHARDAVVVSFINMKPRVTFVPRGTTHNDEQTAGADRAYIFELK